METRNVFVYEPTHKVALSTADDIRKYLLGKTKPIYQVGLFIYSDIVTVRIGSSIEDTNGCLYNEIFNAPFELKSYFNSYKIDGGVLAPFEGTVYNYIDCLVSNISNAGKGLPPGYFEDMNTILKGGEVREDSGI